MLFRIENIPHRNRTWKGKCRGCNRHSTYKIKLHKLKPAFRIKGDEVVKEYVPIGKSPYLLCSKGCVTIAQLKFL